MMNLNRTGKRMGALSWVLILAFLLTSLGQVNGVVLAQDEVPTETPAATEETPTSEVTEAPAIPAEPTEILPTETPTAPYPTETVTFEPTEENGSEVEALEGAPANDLIPNAIEIFTDTLLTEDTSGATISAEAAGAELADPINVCNANDVESVWFQFTALSSGIYEINVAGTDYLPNISILNVVSDT